jgi:hypothetical protein
MLKLEDLRVASFSTRARSTSFSTTARQFTSVPNCRRATDRVRQDIMALGNTFQIGEGASFQLAVSPVTFYELTRTSDPTRRYFLKAWFMTVWEHWCDVAANDSHLPSLIDGDDLRVSFLVSGR